MCAQKEDASIWIRHLCAEYNCLIAQILCWSGTCCCLLLCFSLVFSTCITMRHFIRKACVRACVCVYITVTIIKYLISVPAYCEINRLQNLANANICKFFTTLRLFFLAIWFEMFSSLTIPVQSWPNQTVIRVVSIWPINGVEYTRKS